MTKNTPADPVHRLRDDLEVVAIGDRLLLCIGNDTSELSGSEALTLARVLELLGAGQSATVVGSTLGLSPVELNAYLTELENRGCFTSPAAPNSGRTSPPIPTAVGIVGTNPTALSLGRRLSLVGCSVSFADWHPWSALDAAVYPDTEGSIGRSAVEVARRVFESLGAGPAEFREVNPWVEGFREWLAPRGMTVLSSRSAAPATHEAVNAVCGELQQPWLSVRSGPSHAEIGPFVHPPSTPCYVCVALRVLLNQTAMPATPPGRTRSTSRESGLELAERADLTALYAMQELRRSGAGSETAASPSILRVAWEGGDTTRFPVLKLPNCPGCGWWPVAPIPG